MIDTSSERKNEDSAKPQFFLSGFTQAAGLRTYAFEGRIDARRLDYTVEVDLALIPGHGIRIQDLPLLCRELLQQQAQPDQVNAFVLTEQRMCSHAEKLAILRQESERKKRPPRPPAVEEPEPQWRPTFG